MEKKSSRKKYQTQKKILKIELSKPIKLIPKELKNFKLHLNSDKNILIFISGINISFLEYSNFFLCLILFS